MLSMKRILLAIFCLSLVSTAWAQRGTSIRQDNGQSPEGPIQEWASTLTDEEIPVVSEILQKGICANEFLGFHGYTWEKAVGYTPAGCPLEGSCDYASNRDATALTAKTVKLLFHVMRKDNGQAAGGATVTTSMIQSLVNRMNNDYASTNVSFELVNVRFHNDSRYAELPTDDFGMANTMNAMKNAYAESPASQCNVFVAFQDTITIPGVGSGVIAGQATFPWQSDAASKTGGLWLNNSYANQYEGTASHEMGHCLGLWHTHHGVTEVNSCSACYEYASGSEGNLRGDFCSDTPPTPRNFNCASPGGSDCQGTSWGRTQYENIMGYSDCSTQIFTAQQSKRMACWLEDRLPGWYDEGTVDPPTGNRVTGSASGTVSGRSSKYYNLTVGGGVIDLSLAWSNTSRDLDLYLLSPSGQVVASSAGYDNPESLTYNTNGVSGTYRVRVYNYSYSSASFTVTATYLPSN